MNKQKLLYSYYRSALCLFILPTVVVVIIPIVVIIVNVDI